MRCFLAIDLPPTLKRELWQINRALAENGIRESATLTTEANLHITLRFLGNIDAVKAATLQSEVAEICVSYTAFQLAPRHIGGFPPLPNARVLWVGVDTLSGDLHALQHDLEAAARRIGCPPETRPFTPHITLARYRRQPHQPENIRHQIDQFERREFGAFQADALTLFSSTASPGAPPRYQAIEKFLFSL